MTMNDDIINAKDILDKIMTPVPLPEMFQPAMVTNARQMAEVQQAIDVRNRHNAKKDAAIFQTAQAAVEQNKLLGKQIESLQQQNQLLQQLYQQAQKEAEERKKEAEESKKQARHNKIFGWVSFAVGTAIGLAGVLVGIFV